MTDQQLRHGLTCILGMLARVEELQYRPFIDEVMNRLDREVEAAADKPKPEERPT